MQEGRGWGAGRLQDQVGNSASGGRGDSSPTGRWGETKGARQLGCRKGDTLSSPFLVPLLSSEKHESGSLLEGRGLRRFEEKEGVTGSFWRGGQTSGARIVGFLGRWRVRWRCRIKSLKFRGQFHHEEN